MADKSQSGNQFDRSTDQKDDNSTDVDSGNMKRLALRVEVLYGPPTAQQEEERDANLRLYRSEKKQD